MQLRTLGFNFISSTALASVVVSMALLGTANAGIFDDDEARKAILDLRAKHEALTRDINERLGTVLTRLDRLEQTARGQLELSNQIEQLRNELSRLRGQLEVQSNELANLQRANRDQATQVAERLRKFDPINVTIDGKVFKIEPGEKQAYDNALASFQSGDFKTAQAALAQFAMQNPQSPLRANAEYWAAASLFAQRDWKNAVVAFQSFTKNYADSVRVPDALLNIGNAQIELRDRVAARKALELVIEKYPDSTAATAARDRLSNLPK
jgi:tol-pal system protein YbgF